MQRYNDSPKNNTWFYIIATLKIHFKYIASISTLSLRYLSFHPYICHFSFWTFAEWGDFIYYKISIGEVIYESKNGVSKRVQRCYESHR